MSTIVTRAGKGSPLTNTEVDSNFSNLNTDKLESSSYTAADVLSKLLTVDGASSSLDADLLDGQHGSYYSAARRLPVVQQLTSSSSITPVSTEDLIDITALAANTTINNVSGTPNNGQVLVIRFKDNGTARTIAFGTGYVSGGSTLPTTTVISKMLHCGFIYNSNTSKFVLVALDREQ